MALGCEPLRDLVIENATSQTLVIRWEDASLGKVEPGKRIVQRGIPGTAPMLIEARSEKGDIVFSKEVTFRELENIGGRTYMVVIKESPATDNVTQLMSDL
jgi:hypothetical protein